MKVSIVIPVYNEEKDIEACLFSLEKQTLKDFEIIVVDDGSIDKTSEIAKSFNKVKVIAGKHRGPGFSRNLGAKIARGEILVFIDADMEFPNYYLKNLVRPILEDKTGKIIGTTHDYEIVKNITNIWSRCWGKIRVNKEEAKSVKIFRAIKRDKFLKMNGFDSKYGYADDQTFWIKYKIKPIIAKNTTCYHKNPETLKAIYNQSRWIGASLENIWLNLPLLKYLIPPVMVVLSPLAIPILAIKKAIKNKDLRIIMPMLIFMLSRYFGTISGLFRKIYLNKNIR